MLGGGALLAGSPLGLGLRVVGILAMAAAVWQLRPSDDPPTKRRMTYAVVALGLSGWLFALGSSVLGCAALLPAVVFAGQGLVSMARNQAWSYGTRAWRRAYLVSAVCSGVSFLVLCASWLAGGGLLADPLVGLFGGAWIALPCLLTTLAAALSARERAQGEGGEVPFWARVTASRLGTGALALVLLLPLWLLVPIAVHYLSSPTFADYAAENSDEWSPAEEGLTIEATVKDRSWITGRVLGLRLEKDDPPFPQPLQSAAHRVRLTMHHGDLELVHVEGEVIGTMDELTGALTGARVRVEPLRPPPGFHAFVHTRIDLDGPTSGEAGGGNLVRVVPFTLHVGVVSGKGASRIVTERVKGLDPGRLSDIPGVEPTPLAWYLPDMAGIPSLRGDGAPEGGLRYLAVIQGRLELRQDGARKQQVTTVSRFRASTLEYSYTVQLQESALVQNAAAVERATRGYRWENTRRWNGRVW